MQRLDILDGMRGYFLLFMTLNHLSFGGGYLLVKLNHGQIGYVEDAQGFVFLSGLLIGLVHARQMQNRGYAPVARRMWRRALELYRWDIACIAVVVMLGAVLTGARAAWEPWLWSLGETPLLLLGASATLLYQPTYMDILPQYILYLLAAPPLLYLCIAGRWRLVAASSAMLWIGVQFGLHLPLMDAIDRAMKAVDPGLMLRAHFNVLAWQLVFMSGLVLGALTALGRLRWDSLLSATRADHAWASLGVLLFFLGWRIGFGLDLVPQPVADRFASLDSRSEFSPIYLLDFAATAYLVAWLLIAGPHAASGFVRRASAVLRAVFMLPFLRLIGRHSLHVYVWHVIAVYLLKVLDDRMGPFGEGTKTLIALGAVASLALPAWVREWQAARSRRHTATPRPA